MCRVCARLGVGTGRLEGRRGEERSFDSLRSLRMTILRRMVSLKVESSEWPPPPGCFGAKSAELVALIGDSILGAAQECAIV